MWGSTVAAAAEQRARSIAAGATALDELTALTERCLLADLGDALPAVLAAVRDRAALEGDVTHLMAALPALVRAARYGDVRGTDPARLGEVAIEMITRICAGLPVAVASLDETAERVMRERIDAVNSATGLLADGGSRDRWLDTLACWPGWTTPPDPPRGHGPQVPPVDLRSADPAAARRRASRARTRRQRGCPARCPPPPRPGRRGLGRGVPGRQRPAARPRRQAARPGGRLAGRAERGRLRRRAARAAAHVRRIRATGTAGDRAAGRPARRQPPRPPPSVASPATTSTRSGRRWRPGRGLSFSGPVRPGRWRHDRRPRRADAALAPGARRGGGVRDAAGRRRRAHRRGPGRALRLRREHPAAHAAPRPGRVRRVRSARGPLARRHPHVLPGQRGSGHAEGRHRAARPDPAAARARDAGRG